MLDRLVAALHLENLGLLALVDIVILAVLVYQLLLLIRGTRSVHMLVAMAALLLFYLLTGPGLFHLTAVHGLLRNLVIFLPLAVIVLFQGQIRQALANLGRNPLGLFFRSKKTEDNLIEEIALAAVSLASKRLGALIVLERDLGLRTFCETGIALDALVSYDLLMNLFTRRSPLHDGAVIIGEGRIKAASCFLPLTTNASLSTIYGTRHRAAIGITEESDAIAVVISEERGVVSVAEDGEIREDLDAKALAAELRRTLHPGHEPATRENTARPGRMVATDPSDA